MPERKPENESELIPAMPVEATASAASASISVNPAVLIALGLAERDNFDASREPIHSDLKACALAREGDGSAA